MRKPFIVTLLFFFTTIIYSQDSSYIALYDELNELHTDRKEYIAGEIVWFKLLVENLNNIDAARFSKIAYVEVVNSNGFPVSRKKVSLKNKMGCGELRLPDTLSSGIYNVIAYTNWMKNAKFRFIKTSILIYNPLKPFLEKNQSTQRTNIEISLGGNDLVNGLRNTVYFRLSNNITEDGNVYIKETSDSIVKELKFVKSFGEIEFTPDINNKYLFYFENKDTSIDVLLPDVKSDGLIISMENNNSISIDFRIQCTDLFRSSSKRISYNLNHSLTSSTLDLEKTTLLSILKDSLIEGENEIIFRNQKGQIIWQRDFYGKNDNYPLKIEGIKFGELEKRKIASLSISKENSTDSNDSLNFSISVRKVPSPEFISYKKLTNDIFDEAKTAEIGQLNNNLIFKSYNKADSINIIKYIPEFKGALLSGKIINSEGLPLTNNDIFLSYPDSIVNVKITRTNEEGEFSFFVKPDKPVRDILINANNRSMDLTILLDNNFLDEYPVSKDYEVDLNEEYKNYLTELYLNYKINQLYDLQKDNVDSIFPPNRNKSMYDKGVRIINFDNFMKMDSIREYFYEIIPEVKIIKQGVNTQFRVRDIKTNKPYNSEPAMFVDGIYVNEAKLILSLNPNNCKRIEIIQKPILLKNRVHEGLIAIFSKKYDFPVALPSNTLRMEYSIFDKSNIFESIIAEDSITPSFSNTLYWNPNVNISRTSAKIEFYTGDDNSWYEIIIRGTTSTGKSIYTRIPFKVTDKKP